MLAIAAVHEVLTERRDDDVDLAELLERLRAMLVQGLGAAKLVDAELEPVLLAGNRATALALVFSELFQNALEHGGSAVQVELATRKGQIVLAIADDGEGMTGDGSPGTGLSIVRALIRDELGGTLSLSSNGGFREVPAAVVRRQAALRRCHDWRTGWNLLVRTKMQSPFLQAGERANSKETRVGAPRSS